MLTYLGFIYAKYLENFLTNVCFRFMLLFQEEKKIV